MGGKVSPCKQGHRVRVAAGRWAVSLELPGRLAFPHQSRDVRLSDKASVWLSVMAGPRPSVLARSWRC